MIRSRGPLDEPRFLLRERFLDWQCRVRRTAMRRDDGRPAAGMRPRVRVGARDAGCIVVLLNRRDPLRCGQEFRHMVLRTQDPRERHHAALRYLSADYYQHPAAFSDTLTALFGPASKRVALLCGKGDCRLEFRCPDRSDPADYRLYCAVETLPEDSPLYQASYWHNRLFNSAIPAGACILAFLPDWSRSTHALGGSGRRRAIP